MNYTTANKDDSRNTILLDNSPGGTHWGYWQDLGPQDRRRSFLYLALKRKGKVGFGGPGRCRSCRFLDSWPSDVSRNRLRPCWPWIFFWTWCILKFVTTCCCSKSHIIVLLFLEKNLQLVDTRPTKRGLVNEVNGKLYRKPSETIDLIIKHWCFLQYVQYLEQFCCEELHCRTISGKEPVPRQGRHFDICLDRGGVGWTWSPLTNEINEKC